MPFLDDFSKGVRAFKENVKAVPSVTPTTDRPALAAKPNWKAIGGVGLVVLLAVKLFVPFGGHSAKPDAVAAITGPAPSSTKYYGISDIDALSKRDTPPADAVYVGTSVVVATERQFSNAHPNSREFRLLRGISRVVRLDGDRITENGMLDVVCYTEDTATIQKLPLWVAGETSVEITGVIESLGDYEPDYKMVLTSCTVKEAK